LRRHANKKSDVVRIYLPPDANCLLSGSGSLLMPETPTFGRYAEIPYDEMTPAQNLGA
jgi:hypothetical protein